MTSTTPLAGAADEIASGQSLRSHVPAQAVLTELLRHARPGRRGVARRLLGRSPLKAEAASWYVGALGERRIGKVLSGLPAPWVVLHAVPIGKGDTDIDHLVLGPAGIFTINTEHHPGKVVWVAGRTVLVAGRQQPYIPKAEAEAKAAARSLAAACGAVPVRPIIALVGLKQLTVRENPPFVYVTTERRLVRWLLDQPVLLGPDQLAGLLRLAELPTTWHLAPPHLARASVLEERFRLLLREVRTARWTRAVWAGFAGAGALAALAAGGADLAQSLSEVTTRP